MSLVAVGSIAYDFIETPKNPEGIKVLGGSATYFSVAASFFTHPKPVGVVGDDFAQEDIEFLKGLGIDTTGIIQKPGKTFFWHGRYHDDLESRDSLRTELNVFKDFDPVLKEDFRSPSILFLGNIHPRLQLKVIEQVQNKPLVATDTIDLWIETAIDLLKEVIKRTDLMFVNEEEVIKITGKNNIRAGAEEIMDMGPKAVIVKRGDCGAVLFDQEGWTWVPAYPVENLIDPTGAGDSFAGAVLGFLDKKGDTTLNMIRTSLVVGTAVASLTVEGFGPRALAKRDKKEIRARMDDVIRALNFDVGQLEDCFK